MAASHLIRLKSVTGKNGVLEALSHNKRALPKAEHIDATKTPFNYCLFSALAGGNTPEQIARHAKAQMVLAGIDAPRKNGVMAVEVLFSLPIDRHSQDTKPFFTDCLAWLKQTFAGELLSFDVHLDESAPHAHAIILPLIDGKMQGNAMIGGTGNLIRLINLFHAGVASRYGLSRSDYKRLSAKDKQSIERQVLARLKGDSVMQSCVWARVRDDIHQNPMIYAQMLSIEPDKTLTKANMVGAKVKSFVDIKRSYGKGSFVT